MSKEKRKPPIFFWGPQGFEWLKGLLGSEKWPIGENKWPLYENKAWSYDSQAWRYDSQAWR